MTEFIGASVQLYGHGAGGGQDRGRKRSDERNKPNTTNCTHSYVTLPTVHARVLDVPNTELEGGRKEETELDEGDLGGHGPKMGRNAIEEEEEEEEESVCPCLVEK